MINVISTEYNGQHSFLLEYYAKCKSGEIIVGSEMMKELEMLYQDIYSGEYEFNLEPAHKRINFIEIKCKLFESPFAGQPFILLLWQKAAIEALQAFFMYDDELYKNVRRFQEVVLLVGRKNGKTPFVAAQCLAEWFCGPAGTKILCASNNYEQASLMHDAINNMREESPSLARVTKKNQKGIFFGNPRQKKKVGKFSKQNKGEIRKLSAKTGAKEGRNIAVGAVDEVFEMADDSLVMPIKQSLSTQDEPLYFELTTEGFTNNGYLDKRLVEARQVLKGEKENKRWLIWLYTQDGEAEIWQDEQSWYKSNPSLGAVKKWSYLRKLVNEAKTSSSVRAFVLAKEFNIKQNNAQAWLSNDVITNPVCFSPEDFRGCYYIGGVDISETTDLTCARAMFRHPETGQKYSMKMYFVPEAKADIELSEQNGTNPEKKNYREWQKQGLVTIIPGNEIDTSYISKWFYSLYKNYKMEPYKIGYDNFDAKSFAKEINDYFGADTAVRVQMRVETLSNPMRIVEADLRSKDLIYHEGTEGSSEIDVWCLQNTSFKIDGLGRIMPVKVQGQSQKRIDGSLTYIICYAVLGWFGKEFIALSASVAKKG